MELERDVDFIEGQRTKPLGTNMIKQQLLAAATLCLLASSAWAEGVVSAGYTHLSIKDGGTDLSFNVLGGSLGYRYDTGENVVFVPELRVGFGVTDQDISGVKVEIHNYYGFNLRGEIEMGPGYFYLAPSYTRFEVKGSAGGLSASTNEWEFGIGAGVGVNLGDRGAVEVGYENIDDADAVSLTFRLHF